MTSLPRRNPDLRRKLIIQQAEKLLKDEGLEELGIDPKALADRHDRAALQGRLRRHDRRRRRCSVRNLLLHSPRHSLAGSDMSIFPRRLIHLAELTLADAREAKLKIVTAESCTGGLIAALLTDIAGSSDVVERGFVVYSNEAKRDMLDVPGDLIADFGAVSEPVARAMAEGALKNSRGHIAVSVTGIAGPGGGTPMKPVGLVHFGAARSGRSILHEMQLFGDIGRDEIRMKSVETALNLVRRMM